MATRSVAELPNMPMDSFNQCPATPFSANSFTHIATDLYMSALPELRCLDSVARGGALTPRHKSH